MPPDSHQSPTPLKQSAGLIPFCRKSGQTFFLLQKTFTGRKVGYFIDFGGGSNPGESQKQTAAREFVEETETLWLSDDIDQAVRSPERIASQAAQVLKLLESTLATHPDWWSRRQILDQEKPKEWRSFFVEFAYKDLDPLNTAWRLDNNRRFKKRRELHWIESSQLLHFYNAEPERLWKRVRQLERGPEIVRAITEAFL